MILLIDNYDSFTYNLVQRLGEIDPSLNICVERNDRISVDQALALKPSHVIISPGPCTPREAGISGGIIRAFAGRVPILGVCLGHQCIGDLHGMAVVRHAIPVHGKTSPISHDNQGLFAGLSNPFIATRYHSLVVLEETIPVPPSADSSQPVPSSGYWAASAWTNEPIDPANFTGPTRRVVMGLRRVWSKAEEQVLGCRPAPMEGVQFHPESFLTVEGPKLLRNFLQS